MKNFSKILLLSLSLSSVYLCSFCIAQTESAIPGRINPGDQLKIRITKDNFTDFRESLILNIQDEKIRLDSLYFSNMNLKLTRTSNPDIISSLREAPSKYSPAKKFINEPESNGNPPNVYNINLGSAENLIEKTFISSNFAIQNNLSEFTAFQLLEKSKLAIKTRKNDEAELYLDNAAIKARNNSWTLAEIADNYVQIKKYNKANKAWEKAVAANPNRIELLYSYAIFLSKNNQLDKSAKYLNRIISINPKFMLAYYNLGNIYFKKEMYLNAIRAYSKAISINPYSEDAHYNLALSLEAINQKKLAINYYKECLKLNPSDNQVKIALKRLKGIK